MKMRWKFRGIVASKKGIDYLWCVLSVSGFFQQKNRRQNKSLNKPQTTQSVRQSENHFESFSYHVSWSRLRYDCTKFQRRYNYYRVSRANTSTAAQKHFLDQIGFEADICLEGLPYRAYLLAPVTFKSGLQSFYPKYYSDPGANGFDVSRITGLKSLSRVYKRIPVFLKVRTYAWNTNSWSPVQI